MIWFFFGLGLGFPLGALLGIIAICLCMAQKESENNAEM